MLAFSVKRLSLLQRMDYYNSPVVELQKSLCRFKDVYFKLKKAELILFPIFIIVLMPICAKGLRNFDIMQDPMKLVIAIILAIAIGLPVGLWIYKHLYEKKIKNTSDFLEEIKRFEEEN